MPVAELWYIRKLCSKIGCHVNIPQGMEKKVRSIIYNQISIIGKKIVKIGLTDPELLVSERSLKNISKFAERAK